MVLQYWVSALQEHTVEAADREAGTQLIDEAAATGRQLASLAFVA